MNKNEIKIDFKNLKKLPSDIPEVVKGNFNCSYNKISSLIGAPKVVKGVFDCSYNKLTDLVGAPDIIEGDFDCYYNLLVNLEYCPTKISGGLFVMNNRLTSLDGAPRKISGSFNCSFNGLTDLVGSPQHINGFFNCERNMLDTLKGGPLNIKGDYDCCSNKDLIDVSDVIETTVHGEFLITYHPELAVLPLAKFIPNLKIIKSKINIFLQDIRGDLLKPKIISLQLKLMENGFEENARWTPM